MSRTAIATWSRRNPIYPSNPTCPRSKGLPPASLPLYPGAPVRAERRSRPREPWLREMVDAGLPAVDHELGELVEDRRRRRVDEPPEDAQPKGLAALLL